jgi:heme exporter protein C
VDIVFFTKIEKKLFYIALILSLVFSIAGFYFIAISPEDYQQGDFVRIMYIHVPSAWMALGIYVFIGVCSVIQIIWRNTLSEIAANQSALIGAAFALVTLVTGSIWGKNIWGAWWVWDARLTSMFILFLFYLSYISLYCSTRDRAMRSDAPAILAIVGLINIPIIKFSVNIWATLHQPSSVFRQDGISIASDMLVPLILMFFMVICVFVTLLVVRIKAEIFRKKILRINRNSFS